MIQCSVPIILGNVFRSLSRIIRLVVGIIGRGSRTAGGIFISSVDYLFVLFTNAIFPISSLYFLTIAVGAADHTLTEDKSIAPEKGLIKQYEYELKKVRKTEKKAIDKGIDRTALRGTRRHS